MARFKKYDYTQDRLPPIRFDRQILPGTFEFALSHIIVTDLDLSEFEQMYSNDQTGAPAYDPAILTQARKELYKQTLEKKISKLSRWLKQHDDKIGKSGKAIQSNITDNDSAKMRTSKGVIQGYNGVAVADGKHLTQPEKDIQIWTAVEHQLMAG